MRYLYILLRSIISVQKPAVDPAQFQCQISSPVNAPIWSNGVPQVALTHIFCGEIDKYGKAQGYHSHPGNIDPTCAKASDRVATNTYPLECFKQVEIYDSNHQMWIPRKQGKYYCFFPSNWNIVETVNKLTTFYNMCQDQSKRNDALVCIEIMKPNNAGVYYKIVIFDEGINSKKITSAFPIPPKWDLPAYCNRICTVQHQVAVYEAEE